MNILVRNRRIRGWSLLEIIVAVAIVATLAGVGISSYFQWFRANMRRAEMLISQIETLKQGLSAAIVSGETSTPADESALAAQILPSIKVQGGALTGNPQTDAQTLDVSSISVGTLDTVDGTGTVVMPGTSASITLTNGVVVTSTSR
ncbi:MAG: type II secretion system protein [Verrucomicrobia bacterium]|nr:type II secretion system protein [Verrucomicrobiota bacterium]